MVLTQVSYVSGAYTDIAGTAAGHKRLTLPQPPHLASSQQSNLTTVGLGLPGLLRSLGDAGGRCTVFPSLTLEDPELLAKGSKASPDGKENQPV